jgi:hypothetical protein
MCAGCLRDSTFDSQLLYAHILPNSASVTRLDSHTSQKTWNYIKTRGFKPFRDTYLQSAISQSLLNHILTKNRGWGVGYLAPTSNFKLPTSALPVTGHERFRRVPTPVGTNHESPVTNLPLSTFNYGLLTLLALGETRLPRHTSNPIGKRVPGKRGWL